MSSPASRMLNSLATITHAPSQHAPNAEYSLENLRQDSFSLDEKFSGLSVKAESFEVAPQAVAKDVTRGVPIIGHHTTFSSSHRSTSSVPSTGSGNEADPSTCFIYAVGNQEIFEYYQNGRFSFALEKPSFASIHTRSKAQEVFIYYTDKRDAELVMKGYLAFGFGSLGLPLSGVATRFITAAEFCYSTRDTHKPRTLRDLGRTFETGHDGQMVFVAQAPAQLQVTERVQAYAKDKLKALISTLAEVYRVRIMAADHIANTITIVVELYVPYKADEVIQIMRRRRDNDIIENMRVQCALRGEELLAPSLRQFPSNDSGFSEGRVVAHGSYFDADLGVVDKLASTPSPPNGSVFGAIGDRRPLQSMQSVDPFHFQTAQPDGFGFSNNYGYGHFRRENKNFIDLIRVKQGLDVRTTVMLRNIPNRITHRMLKEVMDEHVWGTYDFMYLRIDFQNNCNVGYAFINFGHPKDVATFVEAVAGKKWRHSDKVAEVSYATIQGRETLISRFRNSSVMQEGLESRPRVGGLWNSVGGIGSSPKLYKILPDPKAGEEEEFPSPDNLFKLARSTQNAAHIGLFNPNRGGPAHLGDRHRQGRFDRGTSFAMIERMMAENLMLRQLQGLPPHRNIPFY